ncbi:MAG: hypothetical protein WCO56_26510 [Verrucomicrobiota bacterium]
MKPEENTPSGKPDTSRETCFIIMPFGGWFDEYHKLIYKPAIEAAHLNPIRADDVYRSGTIINDIWNFTKKAKLVLADLTGKNPNVLYELGLAHALAKPAILVAEMIDDVPFDLRALRIILYNKNEPQWDKKLSEKITKAVNEIMASELSAVLPTFLEVRPDSEKKKISEQDKTLLELRAELNLLKMEVRSKSPCSSEEILSTVSQYHPLKSYPPDVQQILQEALESQHAVPKITTKPAKKVS